MHLKPWNWLEALRPGFRALNDFTTTYHGFIDNGINSLVHNSVFFPHPFFPDGFGDTSLQERFSRQIADAHHNVPPVSKIAPTMTHVPAPKGLTIHAGSFESTLPPPLTDLPVESQMARFQFIQPEGWSKQDKKAAVVLLPATGEFHYRRRQQTMAYPLAQSGIATIILEGAFYGSRKPGHQKRSKLRCVSDLLVLGRATIEEARSLLYWAQEEMGADSLIVAGCSMGGLHAAMAGALMPSPVGIVAHVAPPSAFHAFCHGVLFQKTAIGELTKQIEEWGETKSLVDCMIEHLSIADISKFPTPVQPNAAVITLGRCDQYVPFSSSMRVWEAVQERWNGCRLVVIDAGHVTGIVIEREIFRHSVVSVARQLLDADTHPSTPVFLQD